jgi:hypothetical protein
MVFDKLEGKSAHTKGRLNKVKLPFSKSAVLLVAFIFMGSFAFSQTLYNITSAGNGNWTTTTLWSTTSHAGANCGCYPGDGTHANYNVNIGGARTITLNNTTVSVASVTVSDDATVSTLVIGNGTATASALTITGALTINSGSTVTVGGTAAGTTNTITAGSIALNTGTFNLGNTGNSTSTVTVSGNITNSGTFQSSGNGGGTFALNLGGNLTNNSTVNLANATEGSTLTFNGGTTQTVSGTGTTTIYAAQMSTTASANVNINSSIAINNNLTFTNAGLLVVNSSSNITFASAATITGAGSTKYIQLDGASGSNSQVIRNNAGTTAGWQFLFPIGTSSGGYTQLDLTTSTITTAPTNGSSLAVKAIYNASVAGHLRRSFRMVVSGNNNATTITGTNFYYNSGSDLSGADLLSSYNTIWFLNINTGSWASVPGTAPGGSGFFTGSSTGQMLSSGTYFYTIGSASSYQAWYSYQTGNFSDVNIWTLDPSGTTLVNPYSVYPSDGDVITILNGFTVTADISNINLYATTINGGGTLDMAATTGNSLGTVSGSGLLRVNGISLPTGTYTNFVSATGGTVEYYNTGGNLPTSQTTYNNLYLTNSTNSAITYVMASNLSVNNALKVNQSAGTGTVAWQINDNSNTSRTLSIAGDLAVSSGGIIKVGTGNAGSTTPHALTLYGNFTNNGVVQFFDSTGTGTQAYNITTYNNSSIYSAALQGNTVNVTFTGGTNATLTCNNHTDFYRLIVNKGSGQQSTLILNSAKANYMRLYGPANLGSSGASQPVEKSDNALSLVNGTLELTGTLAIPLLTLHSGSAGNDYFAIPQTASLWVNGAGVSVTVASSTVNGSNDQRIMLQGLLQLTNGTINFGYSKGLGSGDAGTVIIQGGIMNVYQIRPRAASTTQAFSYVQTGGVVNVGTTGYNSTPAIGGVVNAGYGRISIPVATSSFQMTGGILNIGQPTSNSPGGIEIASSSSNYSVTGGTINAYIPASATNFTINSTAPLYNLNIYKEGVGTGTAQMQAALTILNNLTLITGNTPTFATNNFGLSIGGNLTVNSSTTFTPPPSALNTLTFNGTGAQTLTNNGAISTLGFTNLVVNKSVGTTLTLAGSTSPILPATLSTLTLTSGTLADGGSTVTVVTALTNNAIHSGAGKINVNGPTTIAGTNGTFGNLTITTNSTVTVSGNQTVTGALVLSGASSSLSIGSNNLTANTITAGVAFGATCRILTNGFRNDGGFTLQGVAGDLLFPVGTSAAAYSPITINVTAGTQGKLTVMPVKNQHPNVVTTGVSLNYFWRVASSGYASISAVTHKSYTYSSTGLLQGTAGQIAAYSPARFDATTLSWFYQTATYNATGLTVIPNFNPNASWSPSTAVSLDGEYTAGNQTAFIPTASWKTFYSSGTTTTWALATSWSTVAVGSSSNPGSLTPCSTCPVIIGDASHNHTINILANNAACGSLFIASGSTLDCGANTGLNFGVNTSGTGTIRISSTVSPAVFPAGDFTNFLAANGGTVEWYSVANAFTIPSTGSAPQNLNLVNYYNLTVTSASGVGITLPANDLSIYNNFTKGGVGRLTTDATAARTITANTLTVSAGPFTIANGATTNFVITGNTIINGGSIGVQGGGTATHTFTTSGSITNNAQMAFRNAAEVVNITFTGSSNASFTGTGAGGTTLNYVTVNKGTSQTPTLTFDVAGTVTAANTAPTPWLTLVNGTFIFNNAGPYTISSANSSYTIPSTANLTVQSGTVTILSANNTAAILLLNGGLTVSGGTVNVGAAANTVANDIEYASAGTPTITVSGGGNLNVLGAIRRPVTTLAGALVYNQSGTSTTTVFGTATNTTRGIFEIESNTGSSFTMSGSSNLIIANTNGAGASFPDLYLNPVSNAVSSGTTIQMGLNTSTAKTYTYNGVGLIGNFSVIGGGTGLQTVQLISDPMIAAGNLSICSNCSLNSNSLNVSIGGNLATNVTGVYNGSANTTTFNGTGAQSAALSAGSSFQNITISNTSNTVTLSGTAPTITNLNILSGTLDVAGLTTTVNGNIVINSTQINSGGGNITLGGTSTTHAITSGGGTFGNLVIGTGSATKNVTLTGNATITGTLNFASTNRYLSIGSNRLTFSSAGVVSGVGNTAFIRTNGVTSDLGIVKNWPANANTTFTYAIGTGVNYTPVTLNLNVSPLSGGNITVVAVNQAHPTSIAGQQLLNYYWEVTRDNAISYTATGTQTYSYPSSLLGGSGGTLAAGYFDPNAGTLGWITGSAGSSATTTTMTYTNNLTTNMPTTGKFFDYSVGTSTSLPNPIVPVYSRLDDAGVSAPGTGGSWTSLNSWTTSNTGHGSAVTSPPTGVPVVILAGARINMNSNARSAYTSQINGLLVLGTTYAHNLGIISGTGTMQTATNTFPAGNYNAFVASSGGTIQYVAPMTMNGRSTYNNVSTTGAGTVTMTNTDLTLNGSLTIASGVTLDNSTFGKNISLAGSWTNNGGTFSAGSGTVTFAGTSPETITGSTTFSGLTMAASANTTLSGSATTTVTGPLTMSTGNLVSSATHKLSLTATASVIGGSSSSYVSGPMTAVVNAGSSINFPLGDVTANYYRPASLANTTATDTWSTQYFAQNPLLAGYSFLSFNSANLQKVSQYEYWTISPALNTTDADLTLLYNTGSYAGVNIGNVSSLLLAAWDNTNSRWDIPSGGGTFSQSGTVTTGTVTATNVTSFTYPFTFGSTDPTSPLPIRLVSFTGTAKKYGVELQWKTQSELNNDYFTLLHSPSGKDFQSIGTVKGSGTTSESHTYGFTDFKPAIGDNYYQLQQTDFDGHTSTSETILVNILHLDPLVAVYPNPVTNTGVMTIEINGLPTNSSQEIQIVNMQGIAVSTSTAVTDADGSLRTSLSPSALSPGLYILKVRENHIKFVVD